MDETTTDATADSGTSTTRPLMQTIGRRRALTLLGAGLVALTGCGSSGDDAASGTPSTLPRSTSPSSSSTASDAPTTTATDDSCEAVPEETAGPFPGDGSNGPDVLSEDGVVRSDIRSSVGSASGTAEGVQLTIDLTIVEASAGCAPLSGAAVYLWHCDREGGYSMYSSGVEDENYLRGVQVADADGKLQFVSTFPGAYTGRWPHIHFEVFPTIDVATAGSNNILVSQLALPEDVCELVYATDGYEQSIRNLQETSLESDGIFRDGYDLQMATVTGRVDDGYVATLTVAV